MSEPWDPQPPPEDGSYTDANPARCPECRTILDLRGPNERWCPEHGMVMANYSFTDVKFDTGNEGGAE